MNKFILSLIAMILFQFSLTNSIFAGIPIHENSRLTETTTIHSVASKDQNTQKVAKGRWVQKVIAKIAPQGDAKALAIVLAIILPFVGVAIWQDAVTKDFWITLLLTLLLYLPGLIYALTLILNDARG